MTSTLLCVCIVCVFAITSWCVTCPSHWLLAFVSRHSSVRFRFTLQRPLVALTIDDAPSSSTPLLLDELRRVGVRATFFLIGDAVERHPSIVARMVDEGHECANHDWRDRRSVMVPLEQLINDIRRTDIVIKAAANAVMPSSSVCPFTSSSTSPSTYPFTTASSLALPQRIHWFRPGCGIFTCAMIDAVCDRFGYETVLADVYSFDPFFVMQWFPALIYHHMTLRATNGSILILHDGRPSRVETSLTVLRRLIPKLKSRGFQFGTLSELRAQEVQEANKTKK